MRKIRLTENQMLRIANGCLNSVLSESAGDYPERGIASPYERKPWYGKDWEEEEQEEKPKRSSWVSSKLKSKEQEVENPYPHRFYEGRRRYGRRLY